MSQNYQQEIDLLRDILKNTGQGIAAYELDVLFSNSQSWRRYQPKSKNIKDFYKQANAQMSAANVAAIRVSIFANDKLVENPTIIQKDSSVALPNQPPTPQPQTLDLSGLTEISKSNEIQRVIDKYENAAQVKKLEHKYEVDKLYEEMNRLREKISSQEEEMAELAEECEELSNKYEEAMNMLSKNSGEQTKAITTLGGLALGKVFNLEKDEIMELAGMLTGSESERETKQISKGGGIDFEEEELTPAQRQRKAKIDQLVSWMNSQPDDLFEQFWTFLTYITNENGAMEKAYNAVIPNNEEV